LDAEQAMRQGVATARDGTTIAWRLWEGGPGRVACIHSLALDGGIWERVAAALRGRASVLALDCRGHGASGRAPGPYSTALMADDLATVMDSVGWPAATIAGCSMGGCVAQSFAARHPARTNALVLMDTTAWYGPEAPKAWRQRAATAARGGMAALCPFQAARWFSDAFNAARPAVLQHWLDIFEANDVACYEASCLMLGDADLRPLLPSIQARTHVLVGEEDQATPPAMARALAEGISGARLTILPSLRHITPVEGPGHIAAAIAAVMSGG
jgi:3-oxoadipate enol-lactonase